MLITQLSCRPTSALKLAPVVGRQYLMQGARPPRQPLAGDTAPLDQPCLAAEAEAARYHAPERARRDSFHKC